jgi:hypothetical protein
MIASALSALMKADRSLASISPASKLSSSGPNTAKSPQSQPLARAMCAASTRFAVPSLPIASDR